MSGPQGDTPLWTVVAPLATPAFIAAEMLVLSQPLASWLLLPAAALLFGSVFAAVHHAETIAQLLWRTEAIDHLLDAAFDLLEGRGRGHLRSPHPLEHF